MHTPFWHRKNHLEIWEFKQPQEYLLLQAPVRPKIKGSHVHSPTYQVLPQTAFDYRIPSIASSPQSRFNRLQIQFNVVSKCIQAMQIRKLTSQRSKLCRLKQHKTWKRNHHTVVPNRSKLKMWRSQTTEGSMFNTRVWTLEDIWVGVLRLGPMLYVIVVGEGKKIKVRQVPCIDM